MPRKAAPRTLISWPGRRGRAGPCLGSKSFVAFPDLGLLRGLRGRWNLEPDEPVDDVEDRAEEVEEAVGKYEAVETPSTPEMYAPHVFHGTRTEVTVPESSTARDSDSGARPRRSNSPWNILLGRTSATY